MFFFLIRCFFLEFEVFFKIYLVVIDVVVIGFLDFEVGELFIVFVVSMNEEDLIEMEVI